MKKIALILAAASLAAAGAFGALPASDNASDSAYSDGWDTSDNGGFGFGAWTINFSDGGKYIGATGQGDPSFGLFAFNSDPNTSFAAADRSFTGGPLVAGDTFSLDLGHTGYQNAGGVSGINLLSGSTVVFTLKSVFGGTDWLLNDGSGDFSAGVADANNQSFHFSFTYNGGNNYSYTLGNFTQNNFTATSDLTNITGFRLFDAAQGGGENAGFNNFTLVPEPSSLALLAGPAILFAWFFVRRWRTT